MECSGAGSPPSLSGRNACQFVRSLFVDMPTARIERSQSVQRVSYSGLASVTASSPGPG